MKTVATVMQLTRGLLILTPAEYDKAEGGLSLNKKRSGGMPTNFGIPQIFELNDSLKDHPYEKTDELAAFVKRCAESVSMELGDIFFCIEDEDILITKEYKHAQGNKDKLLLTYARVEAEAVLHQDVDKYTVLNFEYGQQYGKSNKSEDVSASLFAMNTGTLTDIRANFTQAGLKVVKVSPPIAGLLHTAKADLNSATRAVAVISMDFAATRLVVLHNGAPVFQQSFSGILEDIAELLMLEFGISKLGAVELIRQEGLGVCNKCNNATIRKQTMTMLDNAIGELVRNLRMVISTLRLDIDQIVLCDVLASLPNIAAYCRKQGLTAPMENVLNIFASGGVRPTVAQSASAKHYDPVSFITFNGLLTMPMNDANLLQGESNILSAMSKDGKSTVGNLIAGVIGVAAAVWIIGISGWWVALEVQKNNDASALNNPEFKKAEQLINDEATWQSRKDNLAKDLETLPQTLHKTSVTFGHSFDEVIHKSHGFNEYKLLNSSVNKDFQSVVNVTFLTSTYDDFMTLRKDITDSGYFSLGEATSSSRVEKTSGGTTTSTYYKNKVKLIITEAGAQEAALTSEELAAREALANNKAKEKEEGKTGTNTDKNNTNNNNNNNQTSQSSSSGEPDLNKKTEIPSDAKIDDALVGNWKYEESGLTMTYEFKSDGTGVAGIMGSSMNFKYGTKDGKIYVNSDVVETSTSAGTAKQRIDGIMDYTVSGDTLKLTSNGQVIDFKKQ